LQFSIYNLNMERVRLIETNYEDLDFLNLSPDSCENCPNQARSQTESNLACNSRDSTLQGRSLPVSWPSYQPSRRRVSVLCLEDIGSVCTSFTWFSPSNFRMHAFVMWCKICEEGTYKSFWLMVTETGQIILLKKNQRVGRSNMTSVTMLRISFACFNFLW